MLLKTFIEKSIIIFLKTIDFIFNKLSIFILTNFSEMSYQSNQHFILVIT